MVRPKKAESAKFLKDHFSYRPDQAGKVADLKKQRKLSAVIQAALDAT